MSSFTSSSDSREDLRARLGEPGPGAGGIQIDRGQLEGHGPVYRLACLGRYLQLRVGALNALDLVVPFTIADDEAVLCLLVEALRPFLHLVGLFQGWRGWSHGEVSRTPPGCGG